MKVTIDGVDYVPQPEKPEGTSLLDALEVRFDSDAGDNLSVRDYLRELLMMVWIEKEGFSGKRPWGNSCWEFELYAALIKAGLIAGKLDEEGYIKSVNHNDARDYVCDLIDAMIHGVRDA